jgi:hypothetical protein
MPRFHDDGSFCGYIGCFVDVTDQRSPVLAAGEKPADQRQHQAEDEAGHNRKVERRVLSTQDDIARKASEADGQALTESDQDS